MIEGHKLCQAYGWCGSAQPAPAPFRAPLVLPSSDVMQQLRPLSLAGRYNGGSGRGGGDDDCKRQWKNAADYCSQVDDIPRKSPEWKKYINIWGGSFDRCMRGQVDERCGGNKIVP